MDRSKVNSFEGFSKLSRNERLKKLKKIGLLTDKEISRLNTRKIIPFSLAEKLIENLIGYYSIPLGVAVNFNINQRDYVIPMAIEETSVIAAASKTAKWIKKCGEIISENLGYLSIGQIQIAKVRNYSAFKAMIETHKKQLIDAVNSGVAKGMHRRGGGMKDLLVRKVSRGDGWDMAVVHIMVETCDAMGANLINQICEFLKSPVENLTGETINLCILSNLTDTKLTRAKVIMHDIDQKSGEAIEEASLFAQCDPYRATTNNKGVLNGMDPVVVATGNDWRAVEAGVHAYAARTGQYSSITQWKMSGKKLIGTLEAPINVGIVGGVTQLHPTASLCLKILGVKNAYELSRIIAAVGLVQNLGALKALTSEGIVKGHMKLHLTNLCLAAGAQEEEVDLLKRYLEQHLATKKNVTVSDAVNILTEIRGSN